VGNYECIGEDSLAAGWSWKVGGDHPRWCFLLVLSFALYKELENRIGTRLSLRIITSRKLSISGWDQSGELLPAILLWNHTFDGFIRMVDHLDEDLKFFGLGSEE